MFLWGFLGFFFLVFFIKAYVMDTQMGIDKSMQFKWVPTTYAFMKMLTKTTLAVFLKTTESLDYMLIGVCAVIRLNTVT